MIRPERITLSAMGDVRGGGTGEEFLDNLKNSSDAPGDKWFHPDATSSWVQASISGPQVRISAYGLCSANDCPDRDPSFWSLRGLKENGDWVTLHEVPKDSPESMFISRHQWLWFSVDEAVADVPVVAVRLELLGVQAPGNGLQLAHFHIMGYDVEDAPSS